MVLWVTALGAVGLCVLLCAMTRTGNETLMEGLAIAAFTLAGWFWLYVRRFVVAAGKRELQHAQLLRRGERTEYRGTLTVTKERLIIRGSIPIRRLILTAPDGARQPLNVIESRARRLEGLQEVTAVYAVNHYAAACEVEDEIH